MKHCSCCDRSLSVDAFHNSTTSSDGLNTWCKECRKRKVQDKTYKSIRQLKSELQEVLSQLDPPQRACFRCTRYLPLAEFHTRGNSRPHAFKSYCKDCDRDNANDWYKRNVEQARASARLRAARHYDGYRRNAHLRRRYGITEDDYQAMLIAQDGKCAICRRDEDQVINEKPKPLSIDHDHVTGAVRGLLCSACNRGIASLGEDPSVLIRASDYLLTPPAAALLFGRAPQ